MSNRGRQKISDIDCAGFRTHKKRSTKYRKLHQEIPCDLVRFRGSVLVFRVQQLPCRGKHPSLVKEGRLPDLFPLHGFWVLCA